MGTQRDVIRCVKNVAKRWQVDWQQGEKGECEERQRGIEKEEEKKKDERASRDWDGDGDDTSIVEQKASCLILRQEEAEKDGEDLQFDF